LLNFIDKLMILLSLLLPLFVVFYKRKEFGDEINSKNCFWGGIVLVFLSVLLIGFFEGSEKIIGCLLLRTFEIFGKAIPFGYGMILSGIILFLIKFKDNVYK